MRLDAREEALVQKGVELGVPSPAYRNGIDIEELQPVRHLPLDDRRRLTCMLLKPVRVAYDDVEDIFYLSALELGHEVVSSEEIGPGEKALDQGLLRERPDWAAVEEVQGSVLPELIIGICLIVIIPGAVVKEFQA